MEAMSEACATSGRKRSNKQRFQFNPEDLNISDVLFEDSGSEYNPNSEEVDPESSDVEEVSEVHQMKCAGTEGNTGTRPNQQTKGTHSTENGSSNGIPSKRIKLNKRKVNKSLRNKGKEYRSGQHLHEKREMGEDCGCKIKCYEVLGKNTREKLFSDFRELGNYELQNAYIHGRLSVTPVKRRYTNKGDGSRRSNSIQYTVLKGSEVTKICKIAFLNIHGLQKSRGRVEILAKKISQGMSSLPLDKRGTHNTRKNMFTEEQKDFVLQHINKIPKYQSHYSRRHNMDKMYIGHEFSMTNIYDDYQNNFCKERNITPVSIDKYRKIFRTLNIGFKHPKSDNCKTCDSLHLKIKECRLKQNAGELKKALTEQEHHQRKAQAGAETIKQFRKLAKVDEDTLVFTFDLQQALPIPKLSTGPAFYSRKIWGYNLSLHDCKNEKGYFYFWDEPTAGRGPEEIVSCLKKHFETLNLTGKRLVMFSDNCGGQNKNWSVVSFWSYLVASGRFERLEHYFPTPGHTMLPSDQDFGVVESYVRRHVQFVYSPEQWVEILKKASHKTPFAVTHMQQSDFISLENLRGKFTFRTKNEDKNPVKFKDAVTFTISKPDVMKLKIRHHYNGEDDTVNRCRRGQTGCPSQSQFPKKYTDLRKIDEAKLKDIAALQQYIPPSEYNNYFMKLKKGRKPEGELDEDTYGDAYMSASEEV